MPYSPTETSPLVLLKEHWGHVAFRPGQAEIIDSVLPKQDCFVPDLDLKALAKVLLPLPAEEVTLPVPQAAATMVNG